MKNVWVRTCSIFKPICSFALIYDVIITMCIKNRKLWCTFFLQNYFALKMFVWYPEYRDIDQSNIQWNIKSTLN